MFKGKKDLRRQMQGLVDEVNRLSRSVWILENPPKYDLLQRVNAELQDMYSPLEKITGTIVDRDVNRLNNWSYKIYTGETFVWVSERDIVE